MITMALTVATMANAISAENAPAMRGPNRLEAEREPIATTPFIFSSGVAYTKTRLSPGKQPATKRGACRQRHRQRALRTAQFLGHIRGRVPSAVGHHYPQQADEKLRRNGPVEVRTAVSEKWPQLPVPIAKPSTTKLTITVSLIAVSTFCTLAVRPHPQAVEHGESRDQQTRPRPARGPGAGEKVPEPITSERWPV